MEHGHNKNEKIESKRNISRFFVEQRHIAWVMLIGVCIWAFSVTRICRSAKTRTRL